MARANGAGRWLAVVPVLIWAGLWTGVGPVPAQAQQRSDTGYAEAMEREHREDRPVPSPAATGPTPRVEAGPVSFAIAGGGRARGFLARPESHPGAPGLVVIHEWWGLNDNIRQMARQLAARGYAALAVDLYGGSVATTPERARQLMSAALADPESMHAILRGAHAHLAGPLGASRTGSIGWCFGGGLSLETALLLPGELDAAVIYYGRVDRARAELAKLTTPILGHFGGADRGIPVASVRAFEAALAELGRPAEIDVYPDAGHAFANPSGTRYDARAAELAWERTLRFFEQHLRPGEPAGAGPP